MTIGRALRIAVHVQVASAALALLVVGGDTVLSGSIMLVLAAIAFFSGGLWPKDTKRRKQIWNGLAGVMLVLFIGELVLTSDLLPPVVRLVVFLTTYKLFNITANRDYITLLLLSFLQMLAATSISYESIYAIPFICYVISSCITLVLHTRKTGLEREQLSRNVITGFPSRTNLEAVRAKKLLAAFGLSLAVLVTTAALFPLFPRLRTNITAPGAENSQQSISGFSDQVSLGAMSDIKTSPQVVMRLQLDDGATSLVRRPKMKGITLSQFDGYYWRHSFDGGRTVRRDRQSRFDLNQTSEGVDLAQEVFLNPINTRVIFGTGIPQNTIGPFGIVYVDNMGSMIMGRRHESQIRYSMTSKMVPYRGRLIYDQSSPSDITLQQLYLQFPENSLFTREEQRQVRELAQQLTEDIPDPFEKALAIERYLSQEFEYTLQLSQYRDDRNKMAAFLFDRQAGHCEYFASGMTLLCRSIGIPARLVNGFQLGQRNQLGNFFIVRAADAHSWVEVYIPEVGWVEFDPTPAAGQQSEFAVQTPGIFSSIFESLDLFWTQYVLSYDANDQRGLMSTLRGGFETVTSLFSDFSEFLAGMIPGVDEDLKQMLTSIISGALLLAVLVGIYVLVFKQLMRLLRRKKGHKQSQIAFFQQATRLLKQRGIELRPSASARELLESKAIAPAKPTLQRLIQAYEQARFSIDREQQKMAMDKGHGHLADLRKELQKLGKSQPH